MESDGSSTLGERLGLIGGTSAGIDGTGRLTVLGASFMSFTSHDI
jgi:hypothetical protein